MVSQKDTKDNILRVASELFSKKGYKAVTVEEISKILGISKKTFYNFYESKESLAEEFLLVFLEKIKTISDAAAEKVEDPIERLRIKLSQVKEEFFQVNTIFFEDIQKYAPSLWNKYETLRDKRAENLERYIVAGQEKGLFKNISPKAAVAIFLGMGSCILKPDLEKRTGLTREEFFDIITEIYIDGLLCEKKREKE